MAEVRVATFNIENLFARFRFNAGIDPEKAVKDGWNAEETAFDIASPDAKRITAAAIKQTQADVLCCQEVENLDTLKRFRSRHLGGSKIWPYALAIDGNDPRLIDVAVLSKFPIIHARSYAHERLGNSALFSRDCLEIDVLVGKKTLTLFVQHYKSMMGGRANTRARRVVQVERTVEIIKERFGKQSPGSHPWAVLGDFNDYMQTDERARPRSGRWSSGRKSRTWSSASPRRSDGPTTTTTGTSTPSSTTCFPPAPSPMPARGFPRSCATACRAGRSATPGSGSRAWGRTTRRPLTTARWWRPSGCEARSEPAIEAPAEHAR